MIEAAELRKKFRLVHGDEHNLQGNMRVADLHVHIWGDNTDTATRIVAAAAQRLDVVAITNHDNDGYEKASRIRDKRKYELDVIRASEVTARPLIDNDKSHKGNHVLVYKFNQLPLCGMPIAQLLETVENQGAIASLAHPELGNMSYNESEIRTMVENDFPPFFLEVHNGGAAMIDRWADRLRKLREYGFLQSVLQNIPEAHSNRKAKYIYQELAGSLHGATAGSDAHSARSVGSVVTCFPEYMDVFDAIQTGKSVVMERKKMPRVTATNIIMGGRGARKLDRMRENGEIAVFEGP